MEQENKKKVLICFYQQYPTIAKKVEALRETKKKYNADVEFFKKKAMQAEKNFKAESKALWNEIESEIDREGLLPGEKAKDVNMEIDRDLECIKRHVCEEHPLKAILDRLR